MKRRLLAMLLSVLLVTGLIPLSAMAAGATLGIYHSLYEYNPQTQEYVAPSSSYQECKALSSAISTYIGSAKEPCDETTYQIKIPSAKKETPDVSKDATGRPQMTYTYQGTTYTWICLGYITKRFNESSNMPWHMWTADELRNGRGQTVTLGEATNPYVTYIWASADKLEENAPADYETITYTFDFFKPVREDQAVTIQPTEADKIDIPKSVDWANAEIKLWGTSKNIYSLPSYFQQAIYNGEMTNLTDRLLDGTISITWPKGYYFGYIDDRLTEQLEQDGEEFEYLYISVSSGLYEWYGSVNQWWDYVADDGTAEMTYYGDGFDKDITFYSNISDEIQSYLAKPGYVLMKVSASNTLTESSDWSKNEFDEVSRDSISFSGELYQETQVIKKDEAWTITVPAPTATSTGENGEVYLDYTDGTIRWQCVGVQYRKSGQYVKIDHTDWRTQPQIIFTNSAEIGRSLSIRYIWEEVIWDEPPTMYHVEYEFQLPNELSTTSGRRVFPVKHHDDNWGSYDAWDLGDGDNDFEADELLKLQNEIKASDVTVREGTTLVILANAPDNHSGYQDFRDFLAFNNNEKIYYEFAGWKDEKGDVHQIGDSVKVDDLSSDTDTTITLTATWEEIDPISEELYQKAADTLRLQVLSADSSFASPVLVTQWTDTDPNVGTNDKLTGNPVMLNEDNTLYYKMSAKLNSGLFGSSDHIHITKGDCVELTFSLDVDPNLEFAGSETIQITYNNPNLKLESTNFGSVSGPDTNNNYMVTVNKSSLPINTDGGLHLEFTVKIINQSETLFNQQAGDPMEFSGFAFKLKDGVETDGLVIESTANVTGHMDLDKISNTGYHHRFRYYHVRSYLQGDEAQALFGEATDPTAFVHTMEFMDRKLANYDLSQDKIGYLQANTVKAYGSAVTIQPADITIYMGGEGYEGTVGSNGQLVTGEEQLKANGFPEPGFLITLPDALQDIDVTSELTLIYKGEDNEALYQWKFEKYGEGDHNIYRIVPMEGTANRPVRMQFTIGENVVTDDQFNVAQYINQTLAMKVYGEGIEEHKVSFVYNDQEYPIAVEDGWLTVRGTTAGVQTAAVAAQEDFTAATGTPGVTAPAETTYTINNSPVQVDPEHTVALLFDGIIDSLATGVAGETYTQLLKDKVDAVVGAAVDTTRAYDCRYLDLVDQSNGNAWVTASNPVTVYWPLPQGTSSSTHFTLLHFEGLHRSLSPSEITSTLTSASYTPKEVSILRVTDTHVVFEVSSGGFSPFVLVWESGSWLPPITPPVTPEEPDKPDAPDEPDHGPDGLNTEDHYAYIVGYPDGTVRPEGNITRAEVATIFFRLLTDEVRAANWSQISGYTDVAAGSWYNNAISTLSRMGILEGYDDDTFRPNGTITRAEFVTIATRFFQYSAKYTGGFSDVLSGAWYADYIQAGVDLGLIGGYPDGTFAPDEAITRAETCAIVNRTLGRKPHADYLLAESEMNMWPDNLKTAWYYADIHEATNSHDYDWVNAVTETLERWTAKLPERDWAALEEEWSTAHSAPGSAVTD